MAGRQRKGPLEEINVRFDKAQGEEFKKSIDAAKAVLDAIGSGSSVRETTKEK